ncbi:MBL fold metallo-hydrolase [Rhodohalobacter sulfatireducens]|uniref:MBL fold metallo-hydrolase n=1 Tax=Rhodohalobacter sulfatireducens TaxID=2911366 RepID=A0ABS9KFI5_9BACT|nr:MBL fold metallo-hydrolase [Rhodohalobacter sulfatireducens]MCG2589602.1 MBL fold metallo-hydrolase [Rhodohalobacter sulfatireducens]
MYFKQFFDNKLAQYSYLVGCQANGTALVIDPMRDIDQYIDAAADENLTIVAAADTHIHADYISGLREFAERDVKVYASDEGDKDWKYEWLMDSDYDFELLNDGDTFQLGNITFKAWHTPGHTPEHLSYFITDGAAADEPMGIATGDFVFVGDVGRPDLLESAAGQKDVMEPSARTLYKSVEEFKSVPEYLQVWPGHGAGSACGKALGAIPESTVGYELRYNNSLKSATSEDNFVKFILEGQPEPPLYFARMKRDNKVGPAITGGLPQPKRLTLKELKKVTQQEGAVLLDTRNREDFAFGYIPGSLLSPLNKQFNTVAGSYITEDEEIYLVVEEHLAEEAVRDLYRIGYDKIRGFVTPKDLVMYSEQNIGTLEKVDVRTFEGIDEADANSLVLDVRKASEYQEGHIDGALNIAHTRLLPRMDEVPVKRKIYVHCQAGGRSAVAAALLEREGYDVVLIDDNFENYQKPQTA